MRQAKATGACEDLHFDRRAPHALGRAAHKAEQRAPCCCVLVREKHTAFSMPHVRAKSNTINTHRCPAGTMSMTRIHACLTLALPFCILPATSRAVLCVGVLLSRALKKVLMQTLCAMQEEHLSERRAQRGR